MSIIRGKADAYLNDKYLGEVEPIDPTTYKEINAQIAREIQNRIMSGMYVPFHIVEQANKIQPKINTMYRLLQSGETIEHNDEVYTPEFTFRWTKVRDYSEGYYTGARWGALYPPIRRELQVPPSKTNTPVWFYGKLSKPGIYFYGGECPNEDPHYDPVRIELIQSPGPLKAWWAFVCDPPKEPIQEETWISVDLTNLHKLLTPNRKFRLSSPGELTGRPVYYYCSEFLIKIADGKIKYFLPTDTAQYQKLEHCEAKLTPLYNLE